MGAETTIKNKTRPSLRVRILSAVGKAVLVAGITLNVLGLMPALVFAIMTDQYTAVITVALLSIVFWYGLISGIRAWIKNPQTLSSGEVVRK